MLTIRVNRDQCIPSAPSRLLWLSLNPLLVHPTLLVFLQGEHRLDQLVAQPKKLPSSEVYPGATFLGPLELMDDCGYMPPAIAQPQNGE